MGALFHPAMGTSLPPPPDVFPDWWERFFAKVYRTSSCWIWTGALDDSGYGLFKYCNVAYRAHRFSLEQFLGFSIPDGLQALHVCDFPPCVKPLHLSIGTLEDNMADRNAKGRQARGETNSHAKLTEQQVLEIRASDQHPNVVAAIYGVSPSLIYSIVSRRIWRHI